MMKSLLKLIFLIIALTLEAPFVIQDTDQS